MLNLPWLTQATPTATRASAPTPMPSSETVSTVNARPASITGRATPAAPSKVGTQLPPKTVHAKPAKKPAAKFYPVKDRRGLVVGLSATPVPQETAETHAAAFLDWLIEQDEFAGQAVLYAIAGALYTDVFCRVNDLTPFPWRSVSKALEALPGVRRAKQAIDVDDGRRRVKRLVYRLPDAPDDAVEREAA